MVSLSVNTDPAFLIFFTIQYCVITLSIYVYDFYKRFKMEQDKPVWIATRYFPSWLHLRLTCIYIAISTIVFSTMLIPSQQQPNIQHFIIAFGYFTLFILDWIVTVVSAAEFLKIKYKKRINPVGTIIAIIGSILLTLNLILIVLSSVSSVLDPNDHNLYSALLSFIYLVISVALEAIYFHISFVFVFVLDSPVRGGVYSFIDCFVRPLFRFVYCITKYLIVIIVIINYLVDYDDSAENVIFHSYVLPFLLEIWFISYIFTIGRNRPQPPQCVIVNCWRPFIEKYYNYAIHKYNERNTEPLRRKIQWADLKTAERNSKVKKIEMLSHSDVFQNKRSQKAKGRNSSHSKAKRNSIKKEKVRDDEPNHD